MDEVLALPAQGATLPVDTRFDEENSNGNCSLREAFRNAAENDQSCSPDCPAGSATETDTITFDAALDGDRIVLNLSSGSLLLFETEPPGPLVIEGNGPDNTIIDGDADSRVLTIRSLADEAPLAVTVRNVTITNGVSSNGGAIRLSVSSILRCAIRSSRTAKPIPQAAPSRSSPRRVVA